MAYNIAGLKSKRDHFQFFNFIRSYDIILLFETFLEGKDIPMYEHYFKDFFIHVIPAERQTIYGRAKGGCIYGFKRLNNIAKVCSFLHFNNNNDNKCTVIKIEQNKTNIIVIPVYINCNDWSTEFENLNNLFFEFQLNSSYIVMGDCNARIADAQVIQPELNICSNNVNNVRRSKDKIINKRGRQWLEFCENMDLIVLNGRTKGDREGELTFLGAMGASVNDLCCVSFSMLSVIENFVVLDEVFSDHCPISLNFKLYDKVVSEISTIPLLPKLIWTQKDNLKYKGRLNDELNKIVNLNGDPQKSLITLLDCIKRAASVNNNTSYKPLCKKQEWYDWQCFEERRKLLKLLKVYRKTNSIAIKRMYLASQNNYKQLCKSRQSDYYKSVIDNFKNVKDSKQYWDAVKVFKKQNHLYNINIDLDQFKNFFEKLYNPAGTAPTILYVEPFLTDASLDSDFTISELQLVLNKAKNGKAPGLNRITYEFFKNAPGNFLSRLVAVFNKIYDSGIIPSNFKDALIFPLHKKGDTSLVSNYRGISFIDVEAKIFTGILLNRLADWIVKHNIISEFQAGFRKTYATIDNIFSLVNLIEIKLEERSQKKMYLFFIDLKSAFDSVPRDLLFYKLAMIGLSYKFTNVIRNLYDGTRAVVWGEEGVSEFFSTHSGVKQGCLLSPTLFSIYINDLTDILGGGVCLGGINIRILLYADDIVLIADKPEILQQMINSLSSYCQDWGLSVNLEKSKILICRKKGGRLSKNERWYFEGQEVEIVKKYKYLGVQLTPSLSFAPHLKEKLGAAKFGLNCTWSRLLSNQKVPLDCKYKLFEATARCVLCYAGQVWGYKRYEFVERLQRFFIKKLFHLPPNAANYILDLELNLCSLYIYTLQLHFNYILKIMKLPEGRLPKIIAENVVSRNLLWYDIWKNLCTRLDVPFVELNNNSVDVWKEKLSTVICKLKAEEMVAAESKARCGVYHKFYPKLTYNIDYFSNRSFRDTELILKARTETLSLNYRPFKPEICQMCTLCNLHQVEDIVHFICICPILIPYRLKYFNKKILNDNDLRDVLNGFSWANLCNYLKDALNYRKLITNEFNCY